MATLVAKIWRQNRRKNMYLLLIVSAIIGTLGVLPYIRSIRKGESRPRFVTWSVWAILATIMMVASLKDHKIASAVLSLEGVIACGSVAIIGFRHGTMAIGKMDLLSMVGIVLGLISLAVFRQPMVALMIVISIDLAAFIPTFIHGWNMPHEETAISYACGSIAAGLSLAAAILPGFSLSGVLYPLYSIIANGFMVALVVTSRVDWQNWRDYLGRTALTQEVDDSL